MIEFAIVSLALGASLAYVWRYYRRRLPRGDAARQPASERDRDCPPGCSGCPRD